MAYRMSRFPVTLSESEGHVCCYERQNASRGSSASGDLLVYSWSGCMTCMRNCCY